MANGATDIFFRLQSLGFYEFLLPFLLIFTIVFAVLEKTKIFGTTSDGETRRNINGVIALIMGLLIVSNFEVVDRLNLFLPKISLFLVVAIMVMILFGLFGANIEHGLGGWLWIGAAIVTLVAVWWALSPTMGLDFFVPFWVSNNWEVIIVLVIVLIIIFAVIGGGGKDKTGNAVDFINQLIGKGGK